MSAIRKRLDINLISTGSVRAVCKKTAVRRQFGDAVKERGFLECSRLLTVFLVPEVSHMAINKIQSVTRVVARQAVTGKQLLRFASSNGGGDVDLVVRTPAPDEGNLLPI